VLTDGKHPLTARVIVNRAWMHHFGRGLVATPGDLRRARRPAVASRALDWLADEFMRTGWRLKPIHKMILTSTAYRQSSKREPRGERPIPTTAALADEHPPLEAESIRDSMLASRAASTSRCSARRSR
jgi:hypothetical protein